MTTEAPYLAVRVVADRALLLCSPLDTKLVSLRTGQVLAKLAYDDPDTAASCAAVTDLITLDAADSSADDDTIDCLSALVGDDKALAVYRITGSMLQGAATMTKIWTQYVPKRVVKMRWESESKSDKRLVIGDRHGDVRSFVIPITNEEVGETAAKRRRIEEPSGENDNGESSKDGKMEDEEDAGTLHVGHVSFLTDFTLSSFTSSEPQHPASFIITSDRDEHIRISRWGKRRAGYIALRYLLGSLDAVSSFRVIEGDQLRILQSSTSLNEHGKDVCRYPILVSSDGSTLRIWSLHPDSQAEERKDCQLVRSIGDAIKPYVVVDAKKERRRDRLFGKGKLKVQRHTNGAPMLEDPKHHVPLFTPVITKIRSFVQYNQVYLVFTVDGAKALFTISASILASSANGEEAAKHIKATDIGMPVLDYDLHEHNGQVDAWLLADVRREIVSDAAQRLPLTLVRWNSDHQTFSLVSENDHPVLQSQPSTLPLEATWDTVSALVLYDALTLLTKQEFEHPEVKNSITEEGLVRGGLSNYEIQARPTSTSNRGQGETVTRKREKARQEMKQRIEARLAQ